jgi:hypothetical protein
VSQRSNTSRRAGRWRFLPFQSAPFRAEVAIAASDRLLADELRSWLVEIEFPPISVCNAGLGQSCKDLSSIRQSFHSLIQPDYNLLLKGCSLRTKIAQ